MAADTKYSTFAGNATQASSFSAANDRGVQAIVDDPYITGYYYIQFTKLPSFLTGDSNKIAQDVFRINQNAVTLPDVSLNTTEVSTGFGGAGKISYVTSVDTGTDFNIKFLETTGLPILNTLAQWQQNIRDVNTGLSALPNGYLSEYSGEVLIALVKPVLGSKVTENILEKAFFFDKIYPTNVPFSNVNQDITSSDKVEHDVTFKHSGFYHGAEVNKFALSKFSSLGLKSMVESTSGDFEKNLP